MNDELPFFATAAKGTEGALREELRELRLPKVRGDRGGVHFGGELGHAMRACLRSRIAMRVLWRIGGFDAGDPDALYEGAREVDWSRWLDRDRTLAVSATVKHGAMRHSGFVAQRIKDAIVDRLREQAGSRPDVDRSDPDVHVVAHIVRDRVGLFVDLAGRPLSQRGYRTQGGEAPLRETLAAAVLRIGGFRPGTPLVDPMCGSGTIAIEAALWAAAIAPGAGRRFGFERWRCFDDAAAASWRLEQDRAVAFADPIATEIRARDRDPRVLDLARANAARAGVTIRCERAELRDLEVPPGTFIVANPPYGVRLDSKPDWSIDLARTLRRLHGCTLVMITPDRMMPRVLGLRAAHEHTLYNGDLECRLFRWPID